MLGYPEAHSNMVFENISAMSLEFRPGIKISGLNKYIDDIPNYGSDRNQTCQAKSLPMYWQKRSQQLSALQGSYDVSISIDNITTYYLQPQE